MHGNSPHSYPTLIGRVGRDAQVRETSGGHTVANFSMAVNRKKKSGDEVTTWFNVTCWNGLAKYANKGNPLKGRLVYVEGFVSLETYETKDGETRSQIKVTATEMRYLDSRQGNGSAQSGDDELPF